MCWFLKQQEDRTLDGGSTCFEWAVKWYGSLANAHSGFTHALDLVASAKPKCTSYQATLQLGVPLPRIYYPALSVLQSHNLISGCHDYRAITLPSSAAKSFAACVTELLVDLRSRAIKFSSCSTLLMLKLDGPAVDRCCLHASRRALSSRC